MPEVFGPVNAATLEVLARNGFEVVTPEEQCCCGALHLHAGDSEGAERLLRRNRAGFQGDDVDAIILNSAGCGAFLKEYGGEIAGKVRDISEFLHDVGLRPPIRPLRLRVAYDDPCHLLHGQRISHAPRALLRTIPGLDLLDLPRTDECCGGAGIYNLTHSQMSEQLAARKVAAIREIAPDAVATGNPSCLVQIGAAVREAGLPVEVLHPVELLCRAYS
jgi:glycolate oxidase iron-sulfur subunit